MVCFNGEACVYKATGDFASELGRHHELKFYGQLVKSNNSVSEFGLEKNGFDYAGVWRRKSKIINYILLYFRVIPEVMKSDFVYIFYPSALKYVALICWLTSKPYGVYVRGEHGIDDKVSIFFYKKSKVIFTVTELFTKKINSITKNGNAHTIRPMIPFSEKDIIYRPKPSKRDGFNILFLARMDRDKGVEELLYAINELRYVRPKIFLTLIGDGNYLPRVRSLISELGISDFVAIRGGVHCVDDIKSAYLKADLYILPTYHEGFPRTIYEAMIFGAPIATTLVGGIPGLMQDKVNCLEIKPKSAKSIVEQVLFAIDNPDYLYGLSVNARELVREVVDIDRQSHAEHLHEIIDNGIDNNE